MGVEDTIRPHHAILNSFLCFLYVLHVYWSYLILRIAAKQLTTGGAGERGGARGGRCSPAAGGWSAGQPAGSNKTLSPAPALPALPLGPQTTSARWTRPSTTAPRASAACPPPTAPRAACERRRRQRRFDTAGVHA